MCKPLRGARAHNIENISAIDRVRVLRILEYVGDYRWMINTLGRNVVRGVTNFGKNNTITDCTSPMTATDGSIKFTNVLAVNIVRPTINWTPYDDEHLMDVNIGSKCILWDKKNQCIVQAIWTDNGWAHPNGNIIRNDAQGTKHSDITHYALILPPVTDKHY